MKIETIGTRMREQRTKLGLSQQVLASRAGVTQGLIGQIESGINKGSKHIVSLARALEVAPEWLVGETRSLRVLNTAPALPDQTGEVSLAAYLRVQHLDVEAGMGAERLNAEHPEIIGEISISHGYLRNLLGFVPPEGRLVLMTGRGDSMMPTVEPGEILLVDTGMNRFEYDSIYAINLGNGLQVKRLIDVGTAIQVRSDNPLYPTFELPESAVIVGKVILRNRLDRLG